MAARGRWVGGGSALATAGAPTLRAAVARRDAGNKGAGQTAALPTLVDSHLAATSSGRRATDGGAPPPRARKRWRRARRRAQAACGCRLARAAGVHAPGARPAHGVHAREGVGAHVVVCDWRAKGQPPMRGVRTRGESLLLSLLPPGGGRRGARCARVHNRLDAARKAPPARAPPTERPAAPRTLMLSTDRRRRGLRRSRP